MGLHYPSHKDKIKLYCAKGLEFEKMSESVENNLNKEIESSEVNVQEMPNEIGYPVHIHFLELAKMRMNHIEWQWHPELEIIIVNHGEIAFLTNDSNSTLHAGQGVVINSNVMHSVEAVSADANCSMYSVVFHPAFLFGYGDVLMSDKYLTPVIASSSFQYLLLDQDDASQAQLLDSVNGVIADNLIRKFGYELSTKAKLCNFWITLMELVAPTKSRNIKPSHSISMDEARSKEMILYIEEHFAEKITLDDLAASVHISKSECCRCFKRTLNLTPVEFLMKYRISMAATMIQTNDEQADSFSNLAYAVGFNNASYFNKVFRMYLGCTPSEYRRKIKTDPNFNPF